MLKEMARPVLAKQETTAITDVQQALARIESGIKNIHSHREWQKFLAFQSRFYSYSFNNTLLIYSQNAEASFVAGFNSWKKLGRYVKKGEKAIRIFAPCKYAVDKEPDDGQKLYLIKGFKLVSVFDLTQTAGDDSQLPVLINGLDAGSATEEEIYYRLLNTIEIPVTESSAISAKGEYHHDNHTIIIKANLSPVQQLKTLVHEYAHHLHLTNYNDGESRSDKEVLAESVAFIVCQHLKVDSSDYSLPYIKSWMDDPAQFKDIGSKINKIAATIIDKLK